MKQDDFLHLGEKPSYEEAVRLAGKLMELFSSGYTVKVFQCGVLYDDYLGDLNKQEVYNLKDKASKMGKYAGLRVGSVEEINNNAGNWED